MVTVDLEPLPAGCYHVMGIKRSPKKRKSPEGVCELEAYNGSSDCMSHGPDDDSNSSRSQKTHLVDAIGIEFRKYSQRNMTGLF